MRNFLAQVHSQEALRQLDGMKFRPQRLNHLLPIRMSRQATSRCAADTVFAIQLDIKRVECVATWRDGDTNGVVVGALDRVGFGNIVLRFVQLEADLREVVELWDGVASDLGVDASLKNTVKQGVDVRLFSEVKERFGVIGCLHWERN